MTALLPHCHVLTRLGASPIHGIGVFAIAPIAAGTALFPADLAQLHWIDASKLDELHLTAGQRALYDDFAVCRGEHLGCPSSFDLLTPGWYLNQPAEGEQPNVTAAADCTMTAARYIREGEELTVSYATFSER